MANSNPLRTNAFELPEVEVLQPVVKGRLNWVADHYNGDGECEYEETRAATIEDVITVARQVPELREAVVAELAEDIEPVHASLKSVIDAAISLTEISPRGRDRQDNESLQRFYRIVDAIPASVLEGFGIEPVAK